MTTSPHVHAIFGELFDRMFPPITPPDPIPALEADDADHEAVNGLFAGPDWAADLPTLSPDEIAEGDARQEHC